MNAEAVDVVHIFWLAGMTCDGCTVSANGASNPSFEDLVLGRIPFLPQAELHHPMLAQETGDEFLEPYRQAANGTLGAPYIVVLEGSVPDDQALGQGFLAAMGANGQPIRMTDWLTKLAPGAAACVAIGTCATWGGIPAAAGNITGSMSMMDFLGREYRSSTDVPVVNVPGCAPVGDNFTEVVAELLRFIQGLGPRPEFDELGRPLWQFGETVHRHCPKAGYYEEGTFAEEPGDNQCLVEIGCWGPVVQCNITERGAVSHMGGCMVAGGACIGCTMPGFPDKYSPFYKAPPGSAVSGGVSRTTGAVIRRLRRMSMRSGNREQLWEKVGVPSGWDIARGKPSPIDKVNGFFYKRLQYKGTVHHGKRYKKQPVPYTFDVYTKGKPDQAPRDAQGRYMSPEDAQRLGGADVSKKA